MIQLSTGGAVTDPYEERLRVLDAEPDSCSLTMGTVNFGDGVFMNSWPFIQQLYPLTQEREVVPEFELFDLGHVAALHRLLDRFGLPYGGKMHCDFVMGVPGGMPGDAATLVAAVQALPDATTSWSATGIGRTSVAGGAGGALDGRAPARRHGGHADVRQGSAGTRQRRSSSSGWRRSPRWPGGRRCRPTRSATCSRSRSADVASFLADQPVVAEVVRNGLVESVHHGIVVGLDAAGEIAVQIGDPTGVMFPRSASKPIQAVAMLRSGVDLDGELLALAAASHSGEAFHVEGARRILAGVGLDESALQCPPALPMEPDDLARYVRDGGEPDAVHMNCSGKHAAMLATCVVNGWPTETYTDPEHPLQVVIHETLEEFTGDKITDVAVDGCGAPLFGFSLLGLARAFRALGSRRGGHRRAPGRRSVPAAPGMDVGHPARRGPAHARRARPGQQGRRRGRRRGVSLPDGRTVAIKITDGKPARRPRSRSPRCAGSGWTPGPRRARDVAGARRREAGRRDPRGRSDPPGHVRRCEVVTAELRWCRLVG